MIDHTGVVVSDFQRSKTFYQQALAPLGYQLLMEFSAAVTGSTDVAGDREPRAHTDSDVEAGDVVELEPQLASRRQGRSLSRPAELERQISIH